MICRFFYTNCLLLLSSNYDHQKHSFALVLIFSYSIFSSAETSDISFLIKECNEGRANSCGQAGVYYENSENADLKKAEQMYSAGCDLDDMFSCGALIYLPDDKDSFNKINNLQTDIHKNTSAANNSFNSLDETIASFNHRTLSTDLKKSFQLSMTTVHKVKEKPVFIRVS